jgi:hypothetical protein
MRGVNSSFLTDVYPIEGAFQLVDSLEGLKLSIKSTHRKLFYYKMVTHILVFFHIGIVA